MRKKLSLHCRGAITSRIVFVIIVAVVFVAAWALSSCVSRRVERTSVNTVTDLSGRWNDTDSRLVSEEMVQDMLAKPWWGDFRTQHNKRPTIIVGYVRNRSSEHIETTSFTKDIERALINSGKATVVANSTERGQIRDERLDQQTNTAAATIKQLAQETGADYMLIGNIISQYDALDKTQAITYQVDLELVNIESNQKTWIGTKKIKKIITKGKFRKNTAGGAVTK